MRAFAKQHPDGHAIGSVGESIVMYTDPGPFGFVVEVGEEHDSRGVPAGARSITTPVSGSENTVA